jgi:hypothetical protein
VTAVVGGDGRLIDLKIDSSVIDPDDPETLSRLVIDAVRAAHEQVAEFSTKRAEAASGEMNALFAGVRERLAQPSPGLANLRSAVAERITRNQQARQAGPGGAS